MKILITGATSALAHKLKRLSDRGETFIYADQIDLPEFMKKENQFVRIAAGDSPAFAHELLRLSLDLQIDYIYPLRRSEVAALAESRQLFEEYSIKVVVPGKKDIPGFLAPPRPNEKLFIKYDGEYLLEPEFGEKAADPTIQTGVFGIFDNAGVLEYRLFTAD